MNKQKLRLESVGVVYKIGESFFPSPYYEQTISNLELSENRQILIIETTENRRFEVALTNIFIEKNQSL